MEQSFRICRIKGIEIGANWSLLVIAWLITWGLAGAFLPEAVPGRSTLAYWGVGIFASILFFASLVTHELSHALVARRHGVEVKQITLWLFGGVAKLESDNPDPSTELRVGIIGPVVSLAIGVLAGALAAGLGMLEPFELISASLWWLCLINVMLGVFNLAPAFPLDGGRVLRAALWRLWDDRVRATVAAAKAGEVFAYILVGLGFLAFFSGVWLTGLWLVVLGWFLMNAARTETMAVTQTELLGGVTVAQIMTPDPVVAPAYITVEQLIDDYLFRFRHSAYPIVDDAGHPVGMVTLDRLRAVDPALRATTTVRGIAFDLAEVPRAEPTDPAAALVPVLTASRVRRALVYERGELVGIVSLTDIARTLDLRLALAHRQPRAQPQSAQGGITSS